MNLEQLKAQLKEGKITKEQFKEELKKLLEAGTIDQAAHDAEVAALDNNAGGNDPAGFTPEQLEAINKLVQSASDQVRTDYSKQKKDLEDELERLKTEKMTAEQKAEYDRQKAAQELADREAALNAKEVALHTVDVLTELKLPIRFKKFTEKMTNKEEAEAILKDLSVEFNAAIKEAVDNRFKGTGGGNPPGGAGGGGGAATKKWTDMTLTEQGKLFAEDEKAARALATASGVTLNY
ncbi:putative scaffold protein [Bacillus phage vB_BcM_Sam112]|uniref:Putative scaffold protein n=1 Tax=Bacillus phage vB_BcM_Sam112 TaxID=2663324 RepID=A0A5Q2F3U2_9CAUD|nr:putative scaffold protein [Bacillus phage vB_BcM_Sam112]